ncbi:MAG: hypothetical protein AAGG81_00365, partial [Chlamydiota bacterium]
VTGGNSSSPLEQQSGSHDCSKVSKVSDWWLNLLALPVSNHVEEGLAKMSGFEVLRHGTSWPNYIGILKNGGLLEKGGSTSGGFSLSEEARTYQRSKNRFFAFKDTEAYVDGKKGFQGAVAVRVAPKMHAVLSGSALVKENSTLLDKIKKVFSAIFLGFTTPTIRFLYRTSELHPRFKEDPDYRGIAYYTEESLPNDRIGLAGFGKHVTAKDFARQFKHDPLRATQGLLQLIWGIFLTTIGLGTIL